MRRAPVQADRLPQRFAGRDPQDRRLQVFWQSILKQEALRTGFYRLHHQIGVVERGEQDDRGGVVAEGLSARR